LCATAIETLPGVVSVDLKKLPPVGLFRISTKEVARLGTAEIGWISPSPDGKRLAAWVGERKAGKDEPDWQLALFDAKGAPLRVLETEKMGKILPVWIGNGKLLVTLAPDDNLKYE